MSESENTELQQLAERARHEKQVQAVIERFRSAEFAFLRPGERIDLLPLKEGAKDCVTCCEAVSLGDRASVAERTQKFGPGDPLCDALEAAGYRVVVDYDQEKSTGDVDCLRYSLYEKTE